MNPTSSPSKLRLAFIGLGAIGSLVSKNLLSNGFNLTVYTRNLQAELFNDLRGAKFASSSYEAAKNCDFLLLCVGDEKDVEDVIFGKNGVSNSLKAGSTIIDLTTISPSKAIEISARLSKRNIIYFDAPVSGGTEGAKNASLTVFFGGNNESLLNILPILKTFSSSIYPFGSVGKGQQVKAINQILVAGSYAAVAEAIALGQSLHLPMNIVVEALTKGAANSWALENRAMGMIEDSYPLGFKLRLHYKDICIALKTASEVGLNLPVTTAVKSMEEKLIQLGYQNDDISVLRKFIS